MFHSRVLPPFFCALFVVALIAGLAPRVAAQSVPTVTVSAATEIGVGTATLNGGVTATNGSPTTFFFMWGTNDYGTASTSPWRVVNCGVATNGQSFSTNLTGLFYGQRYWSYAYATNASGANWSSATNFLTTDRISVVASANSGWTNNGESLSTLSFTPKANGMLIAAVAGESSGNTNSGTLLSITWNGTPLTLAASGVNGAVNNAFAHIYYLANPAAGSGALSVTLSNNINRQCIGAIYATGVGALESTNAATSTNVQSLTAGPIAATAGALIVDCAGHTAKPFDGSKGIVGGGDTVLYNGTNISSTGGGATYMITAAGGSFSATWSVIGDSSTIQRESVAIVSFAPATAIGLVNSNATGIAARSATLNGMLAGSNTIWDVYAYWGPTNGTNNPSAWSNNAWAGKYTLSGVASTNIAYWASSGITAETTNYFTFFATNAATNLWASPSTQFTSAVRDGTTIIFR
jgi:hypothetical protein